jgi:hypothetical protein
VPNTEAFEAQLNAAQSKLNAIPSLKGKIDLANEWCEIKEAVKAGEAPEIAHKAAERDYSLAFSSNPLVEQVAHLNTHTSPLTFVERLAAERNARSQGGLPR